MDVCCNALSAAHKHVKKYGINEHIDTEEKLTKSLCTTQRQRERREGPRP